jgi:mRNA-degrading endonuclease YafQ of YafQ-DinJ toxin-antitoxin module
MCVYQLFLSVHGGCGCSTSSPINAPYRNISFTVPQNDKTADLLRTLVCEEMDKISRYPDKHEILAAHALKYKLNQYKDIHIDVVKYIDAQSLIRGMNISKEFKRLIFYSINNNLLNVNSLSTIYEALLDQSLHDDNDFRKKVLAEFVHGYKKSNVFRDAMLAFMVRIDSPPFISASAVYSSGQLYAPVSFLPSEPSALTSTSQYNIVKIKGNESYLSFFPFIDLLEKNKTYHMTGCCEMPLFGILFHECGHSTSASFAYTTSNIGIDDSMLLASKFVEVTVDKEACKNRLNSLKQLELEHQKQFLSQFPK